MLFFCNALLLCKTWQPRTCLCDLAAHTDSSSIRNIVHVNLAGIPLQKPLCIALIQQRVLAYEPAHT